RYAVLQRAKHLRLHGNFLNDALRAVGCHPRAHNERVGIIWQRYDLPGVALAVSSLATVRIALIGAPSLEYGKRGRSTFDMRRHKIASPASQARENVRIVR